MCDLLDDLLPGLTHTYPEGGMFLMATLPRGISSRRVFDEGIQKKVAVLPGFPFYVDGGGSDTIRMNFSATSEEQIIEGMHRLARVVAFSPIETKPCYKYVYSLYPTNTGRERMKKTSTVILITILFTHSLLGDDSPRSCRRRAIVSGDTAGNRSPDSRTHGNAYRAARSTDGTEHEMPTVIPPTEEPTITIWTTTL